MSQMMDLSATPHGTSFKTLPMELHMQIASYLPYPDALALKHTNRYFYSFIHTGVQLKVSWVIERSSRHLRVPGRSCVFRTDEAFCRDEIRTIMEKRRWHQECKANKGGCLVVEGTTCGGASPLTFLKKGLLLNRRRVRVDSQAIVIALIVCCLAVVCQRLAGEPFTYPRIFGHPLFVA